MTEFTVGEWDVDISPPHPCWITISYGDTEVCMSHRELRDLEYAVQKAMRHCQALLGRDFREV